MAKYPRQKLVMTSPVEFPMYGKFKKMQLSKENLLAFWDMVLNRADFNVTTGEKVEDVQKDEQGIFTRDYGQQSISISRRDPGAGPRGRTTQTRASKGKTFPK